MRTTTRTWTLDKDLPDAKRHPTYAPALRGRSYMFRTRETWQMVAWRQATGRTTPQSVEGPFLPPNEVGQVLMALGRKSLPSLKV